MTNPAADIAEHGLCMACAGETLVGVLSRPVGAASGVGVLVAVGGPQYRAGSHRQFRLLAARLARAGHVVLRFDSRGMGDSTGEFPGFEALAPDFEAATAALRAQPGVERVVWWGLCDAASAALMNAGGSAPPDGLVLLNPWVRHQATLASVEVKHYYAGRLRDPGFWRKLVAGGVDVPAALGGALARLRRMREGRQGRQAAAPEPADFRERMAAAALRFGGAQLYVMAGRDLVSAEFDEFVRGHAALKGLWARPRVTRADLPEADHTFSSEQRRGAVEGITLDWLARTFGHGQPRPQA